MDNKIKSFKLRGKLGNGSGVVAVPGKPHHVYVIIEVLNQRIPLKPGSGVIIGRTIAGWPIEIIGLAPPTESNMGEVK